MPVCVKYIVMLLEIGIKIAAVICRLPLKQFLF